MPKITKKVQKDTVEEAKKIRKTINKQPKIDVYISNKDNYWQGFTIGIITMVISLVILTLFVAVSYTPDEIYSTIQTLVDGYPYQPGGVVEPK